MNSTLSKAITLLLAIGVSGWLIADDGKRDKEGGPRSMPPVTRANWQQECGSCHTAFHPGLLPERSWRQLMGGLDKHFGENASLDALTQQEITDFLVKNSADRSDNRRSARIAASIPIAATPLRITETPWFVRKHDEIRADVWQRKTIGSKSNCMACHAEADKGNFSEHLVKIPR